MLILPELQMILHHHVRVSWSVTPWPVADQTAANPFRIQETAKMPGSEGCLTTSWPQVIDKGQAAHQVGPPDHHLERQAGGYRENIIKFYFQISLNKNLLILLSLISQGFQSLQQVKSKNYVLMLSLLPSLRRITFLYWIDWGVPSKDQSINGSIPPKSVNHIHCMGFISMG